MTREEFIAALMITPGVSIKVVGGVVEASSFYEVRIGGSGDECCLIIELRKQGPTIDAVGPYEKELLPALATGWRGSHLVDCDWALALQQIVNYLEAAD